MPLLRDVWRGTGGSYNDELRTHGVVNPSSYVVLKRKLCSSASQPCSTPCVGMGGGGGRPSSWKTGVPSAWRGGEHGARTGTHRGPLLGRALLYAVLVEVIPEGQDMGGTRRCHGLGDPRLHIPSRAMHRPARSAIRVAARATAISVPMLRYSSNFGDA